MPRLASVNLLGVLLAAIAIYFAGFLWYGLLFSEAYMNGIGVFFNDAGDTVRWLEADGVQTRTGMGEEGAWMAAGFLIPLALAFGLGFLLKKLKANSISAAAGIGLWVSVLIGVPLMAYGLVYSPWHSWPAFFVDASHTVVSFVAGCVVLSFFD